MHNNVHNNFHVHQLKGCYTFRPLHRQSARQSLTLGQWLTDRMGLSPILPYKLSGHCDGDGDSDGDEMCKHTSKIVHLNEG